MSFPRLERKRNLLDLTPLIDVMFLLLLYFVLTMSADNSAQMPINLSSVTGKNEKQETKFYAITVTSGNLYFAGDEPVAPEKLEENLKLIRKSFDVVLIRGDNESDLGAILKVWESCKKAGFENIKIAVKKNQ